MQGGYPAHVKIKDTQVDNNQLAKNDELQQRPARSSVGIHAFVTVVQKLVSLKYYYKRNALSP